MITAIGIDMAFANMGLSRVEITADRHVRVIDMLLVSTEGRDKKVVRKSSEDLRRARELHVAMGAFAAGAVLAFAEVPSGSQSASAARALGIAVGVLATCPLPIIEVSQQEVKKVLGGRGPASKKEIIDWAVKRWPEAPWLRQAGRILAKNEHLADSLASVLAGIDTPEFQRLLALSIHHEATRIRPARRKLCGS